MGNAYDLRLSLFGDEQLAGTLMGTAHRVEDMSPWFQMMQGWFEGQIRKQFETQGRHLGGKSWKQLSPRYAAWKRANYPGKTILRLDGELERSLTQRGGHAIRHIQAKQMVFGSTVPYGRAHQRGVPERNLPARKMLEFDTRRKRQMTRSLGLFIARDRVSEPGNFSGKGAK